MNPLHPELVDLLRSALQKLESTEGLRPDDPALIEIKSHIVQSIAELELKRTPKAA